MFDEHQQGAFRHLKELKGIISCPRDLSTILEIQTLRSKLQEVKVVKDDGVRHGAQGRRKVPANNAVAALLDLYRTLI
jgi:hypothetical protein